MKPTSHRRQRSSFLCGTSLIEVVLAMGVLALVLPLVFGAFAKTGENAAAAQAETRSTWMIPACLDELEAARLGQSALLPKREPGAAYPQPGETLALAFTAAGQLVAKVPARDYVVGTRNLNGEAVRYFVSIRAQPDPTASTAPGTSLPAAAALSTLRLTLEYPAAAPSHKRRTLAFHTRIP